MIGPSNMVAARWSHAATGRRKLGWVALAGPCVAVFLAAVHLQVSDAAASGGPHPHQGKVKVSSAV